MERATDRKAPATSRFIALGIETGAWIQVSGVLAVVLIIVAGGRLSFPYPWTLVVEWLLLSLGLALAWAGGWSGGGLLGLRLVDSAGQVPAFWRLFLRALPTTAGAWLVVVAFFYTYLAIAAPHAAPHAAPSAASVRFVAREWLYALPFLANYLPLALGRPSTVVDQLLGVKVVNRGQ